MMESCWAVIGTLATTSSFLVEKIVNIAYGTNMEDNSIALLLTIMSFQASSGPPMEIISLLDLLKCSDYATSQGGLTPSTSLTLAPFLNFPGAMMVQ